MGNAALREIADIEPVERADLDGSVVAVDAANWLYKYLTTTTQFTDSDAYTTPDGVELPNLVGAVKGIPKFFEHDLTPIFVFDGVAHDFKEEELEKRRETRSKAEEAAEKALSEGNVVEAAKLNARAQGLTDAIIDTTKELLEHLDIPHVTAPNAGEAFAARLASDDVVDAVISEDYDSLLYGAPLTIRDFTSSSGTLERMSLPRTLEKHNLSHRQIVGIALLCGTDYNPGVRGVGPKTALREMKEHESVEAAFKANEWEIPNRDEIMALFISPIGEYSAPEIDYPSPDVEAAREFVISKGIDASEVDTAFERLEENREQTGLGDWS